MVTDVTGQAAAATDTFETIGGDSLARLGLLVRLEQAASTSIVPTCPCR